MASIYFIGTYKPIICGIADYTNFITRECPAESWGVLSFDLEKIGKRQNKVDKEDMKQLAMALRKVRDDVGEVFDVIQERNKE